MGFGRKRKIQLKTIIRLILYLLILGGAIAATIYYYDSRLEQCESEYETKMQQMELEAYYERKVVYMPKEKILVGTRLTKDLVTQVEIRSHIIQEKYMDDLDFGKATIIDLDKNEPIFKNILIQEVLADDVREQEFSMVLLPSNIEVGKYVDIRIGFPNGEDFIVLSKKRVEAIDLSNQTLRLWLNEKEILTMSSAIVDAYLHKGTKLYCICYVEPEIQQEAIATYPVKLDVVTLIKSNPNIVEEAKKVLEDEVRLTLDEKLATLSLEEMHSIETGLLEEDANRKEVVKEVEEKSNKQPEDLQETTMTEEEIDDEFF